MRNFSVKNFEHFQHYKDRSPPWIKLYNELLDDYKFSALPDASKFHLVAIWLLASRTENKIPYDPAWVGRRISSTSKVDLDGLASAGFLLIDQEVHSTEQVASNLSADSEQSACPEREGEKRKDREETEAERASDFDEFWKVYPKRDGANPKEPARKLFLAAVKAGADPRDIVAGALRCRQVEAKNIGTPYIPQAIKWLRDQRWNDYPANAASDENDGNIDVLDTLALEAWDEYGRKTTGKPYPRNRKGGWRFPTKWPPGHGAKMIDGVEALLARRTA